MTEEELRKNSAIYSLKPTDKLFNYHKSINDACLELCKQQPSLLRDKVQLQKLAVQKINHDGYQYAKKKSRSKQVTPPTTDDSSDKVKAKRLSGEIRSARIKELIEDLKECDLHISLIEKQRIKYSNSQQYTQAITLTDQLSNWRQKKRKMQKELTELQQKEVKSNQYHKSRKSSSSSPTSSSSHAMTIDTLLKRQVPTCEEKNKVEPDGKKTKLVIQENEEGDQGDEKTKAGLSTPAFTNSMSTHTLLKRQVPTCEEKNEVVPDAKKTKLVIQDVAINQSIPFLGQAQRHQMMRNCMPDSPSGQQ